MAEIGKKIKLRREELNLTQEELASKLGYKNKSTIAKIENGINDIVQSKVCEFAAALDTTPAYLMGWEDKYDDKTDYQKNIEMLIEAAKDLSEEDIQFAIEMIKKISKK